VLLLLAAVFTAFESEILVAAIRPAAAALGLTQLFIGVVIVAIAGNAAEHSSAVTVAAKGRMDLVFQPLEIVALAMAV
jgi:Ca2+:H+ antiporter